MRLTIVLIVSLFSGLILAQEGDNVSEKLKAMETRLKILELKNKGKVKL